MKTFLTAEISEALGCAKGEAPELVLRTTDSQGRAYGDFQWPTEPGSLVEAPDWTPEPICGYGLHGALWGQGDGGLLNWNSNALWYVVAARSADIVDLRGKVKFPRCWVLFVGDQKGATDYMRAHGARDSVIGATLEGGDGAVLSGGDHSTLTALYASTLIGGNYSTLEAGGYSNLTANYGSVLKGGNSSVLKAGFHCVLEAGEDSFLTGGRHTTFKGGFSSMFSGGYFTDGRSRRIIGYVGENGILPNVSYELNNCGKFVQV